MYIRRIIFSLRCKYIIIFLAVVVFNLTNVLDKRHYDSFNEIHRLTTNDNYDHLWHVQFKSTHLSSFPHVKHHWTYTSFLSYWQQAFLLSSVVCLKSHCRLPKGVETTDKSKFGFASGLWSSGHCVWIMDGYLYFLSNSSIIIYSLYIICPFIFYIKTFVCKIEFQIISKSINIL